MINESVRLEKGYQLLDGRRFKELILFDSEYQTDLELTKALIEQRLTPQLIDKADTLFTKILGSTESNISYYDFEIRKSALRHWIQSGNSKTEIYPLTGVYSDKIFVLSEDSISDYRQKVYQLPGEPE